MKIVKIWGGVGNQLFQYLLYRSLKNKGEEAYIDLSWFSNEKRKYYYAYQLEKIGLDGDIIDINNECQHTELEYEILRVSEAKKYIPGIFFKAIYFCLRIGKKRLKCVNENILYAFDDNVFTTDDVYLTGFWQNKKYFEKVLESVVQEVHFENITFDNEKEIINKIKACNSVSLHIRRNDYEFEDFDDICSKEYYHKAIEYMKKHVKNPVFFIFSNKPDEAKKILGSSMDIIYVDGNSRNDGLNDMKLMTLCQHNIISNSTFSWWGAALNRNYKKIVIMPLKWRMKDKNLNLKLNDWIEI